MSLQSKIRATRARSTLIPASRHPCTRGTSSCWSPTSSLATTTARASCVPALTATCSVTHPRRDLQLSPIFPATTPRDCLPCCRGNQWRSWRARPIFAAATIPGGRPAGSAGKSWWNTGDRSRPCGQVIAGGPPASDGGSRTGTGACTRRKIGRRGRRRSVLPCPR